MLLIRHSGYWILKTNFDLSNTGFPNWCGHYFLSKKQANNQKWYWGNLRTILTLCYYANIVIEILQPRKSKKVLHEPCLGTRDQQLEERSACPSVTQLMWEAGVQNPDAETRPFPQHVGSTLNLLSHNLKL